MKTKSSVLTEPRVAFLLLLAIAISILFFWVVKEFLLAVFLGAILAGLLHPYYCRLCKWTKGRNSLAAAITVLLSLVLVIVPVMLFIGVVVSEAVKVSESAKDWLTEQKGSSSLQEQVAAHPRLKLLLPYQDQIIAKGTQFASKAGGWVAEGLAAGVKGTVAFFLALFVMLFAMFYFLTDGKAILDAALRYTPLSEDDRTRLLRTFVSVSRATLKGKLIVCTVQGGLAGLSFWFAGIEGVFFWTALMIVLSVIPSVGSALVWVPAVIYLALNGQSGAAIGVALWCAVVVGTIDNVLAPKLIGKDTEMSDLLVLLTTLGGLAAFGAAGILIGPIVGALFVTVWQRWGAAFDEARRANEPKPDESFPS